MARAPTTRAKKPAAKRAPAPVIEVPEPKAKGGRKKVEASPFVSTIEAAALIGVSEVTIRNYRTRDKCPWVEPGGRVIMPKLIAWLIDRQVAPLKLELEAREMVEDSEGGPTIDTLTKRSMSKKNILDDIRIQKELEKLLFKDRLHHQLSVILSEIMSHLRPLGVNLGPRLSVESDPAECTRIVDEEMDSILADMSPDIVIDGRGEEDPFEQADREEAEALKEAEKELKDEDVD